MTDVDFHSHIAGISEIFRDSVYITGLVIIMMLVIEYVNVATKGQRFTNLRKSPVKQVFIGAALGLVPGCMGGFAAVSLFSHNIFGFAGLISAMISDTGDETFIMFAKMPGYALLVKFLTFTVAIFAGLAVNAFVSKRIEHKHFDHSLEIHSECNSHAAENTSESIGHNLKYLSFHRIAILSGILLFMLALGFGLLEHEHEHDGKSDSIELVEHEHDSDCEHEHEHEHDIHGNIFNERWINILFLFVAMSAFVMVLSVNEHFLKEHIFKHIIRRHIFRVFLWTFASLLIIYVLGLFVHYGEWIHENRLVMLFIALITGLIPQSGPHIVFIYLFMGGNIPFSILIANSIVQNGHSGLPLLAETKKGFVKMKSVVFIAGLIIGLTGYFFRW
ncbi:MAG: putative manganese transporter [Prevotellaceae bacterium]|jgi:hypothetical protein|nr:putative manganese transporter [Prevotellaceae bacterium]